MVDTAFDPENLLHWRMLWPVKTGTGLFVGDFVSLDYETRIAHPVSRNTVCGVIAGIFYEKLTHFLMLEDDAWQAEWQKWDGKRAAQLARFPEDTVNGQKMLAFYEALDAVHTRRDLGHMAALNFIFKEEEQPSDPADYLGDERCQEILRRMARDDNGTYAPREDAAVVQRSLDHYLAKSRSK